MPIVISRSLVLAQAQAPFGANLPVIGWRTLVTAGSIAADHEETGYPASNLANPSTALEWRSDDDGDQYVTVVVQDVETIDYVGIARHNLGSAGIAVSVEAHNEPESETPTWVEIAEPYMPANDAPLLLRFLPASYAALRLKLAPGYAPPRAAVVYAGKLTVMSRGLPPGFVPMPYARTDQVVDGVSQGGNYLGQIVTHRALNGSISFQHIPFDWYREHFEPFARMARSRPFFFAWLPQSYPQDVGYAWVTSDIRPETRQMHSHIDVGFSMNYAAVAF